MSCGLEARLPTAEVRRLWNELRVLNETLSECVETAEDYLRSLDERVSKTKSYFAEIRGRLSGIPAGTTVIDEETSKLMRQDAQETKAYFSQMRQEAEDRFVEVTRKRSVWMDETTRLTERQMTVLDNIGIRAFRHNETLRLRARVLKTFQDICNVESEVTKLQRVLYDCEVGKAELEEDFVGLVKIFDELDVLTKKTKETKEDDGSQLMSEDVS